MRESQGIVCFESVSSRQAKETFDVNERPPHDTNQKGYRSILKPELGFQVRC